MKIGDRITIFRELSEVSRNDKGNGMFHNLGIRCWGFIDVVENKPSATGRCIETDTDGDQLFSTYENKAGAGAHTLIGGTGKYAGISGQQTFVAATPVKGYHGQPFARQNEFWAGDDAGEDAIEIGQTHAIIRRLAGIQMAIQWAKVDGSHVFRSHP